MSDDTSSHVRVSHLYDELLLEYVVTPITIASCSPNIFRKSYESALLDLWRFQSSSDESGRGGGLPRSPLLR